MYNPIAAHRQEVSDRIHKGFETDELTKAQYVHKYLDKVMTKTGKTRYIYAQAENVKRIKGKKKMLPHSKEITLKSKSLMPYTDEMTAELEQKICSLQGVQGAKWSNASTDSKYLKFKRNGFKFKVRVSDHTQKTDKNEVLFPLFYSDSDREWMIDANLGHFKPNDVAQAVTSVCDLIDKYDNEKTAGKLEKLANDNGIEPIDKDDAYNKAHDLASKFINEKKLKDDKFGTTYQVLYFISVPVLSHIVDKERDIKKAFEDN